MSNYTARNIRDFWKWIEKTDHCWLYRGNSVINGYGRKWINNKGMMVHHIAWELTYGAIPDGMFVCHSCRNILCVNPNHLFLSKHARNKRDEK